MATTPNFASKIDYPDMTQSVDYNRVQQIYQIVKHGRINVNDFDGASNGGGGIQVSSIGHSVSSMYNMNNYQL